MISVGEGEEISIKAAADTVLNVMEFKGKVVYDTSRPDGQFKKTASNAKLKRYMPHIQFTPFAEGNREDTVNQTCMLQFLCRPLGYIFFMLKST